MQQFQPFERTSSHFALHFKAAPVQNARKGGRIVKISHEKYAKSGVYRLFYCPGCEDFHAFFTHGILPLHAITTPDVLTSQTAAPSSNQTAAPSSNQTAAPSSRQTAAPSSRQTAAPSSNQTGTAAAPRPPPGLSVTPAIIQDLPGRYCALTIEDGQLVYGQECHHHLAGHAIPMIDLREENL